MEFPKPHKNSRMFLMWVKKQLCSLHGRQLHFHVKEEDLFPTL